MLVTCLVLKITIGTASHFMKKTLNTVRTQDLGGHYLMLLFPDTRVIGLPQQILD